MIFSSVLKTYSDRTEAITWSSNFVNLESQAGYNDDHNSHQANILPIWKVYIISIFEDIICFFKSTGIEEKLFLHLMLHVIIW